MTEMTPTPPATDSAPLVAIGFDALIGLEYRIVTPDHVRAEWTVRPELLQPYGLVHGGVYCAVIESVCSVGGATWYADRGVVVGVNNNTDFLRAARSGTLTADARPVHQGRLQQVWQVAITDEEQRVVARGQVRLQNLAQAPGSA
ncbi:PaaI family thioesterase [Skermania piniformis]|uniref:PaaI family thioesterase n=1 Tax=Skermania pinensis TaxID=39122 RepID=A0ABX8S3Q6_9ACTN|nr:PaaI family thioesterase [Skermania piniformis]QXQ12445.1 PaaI family thioesterase [Skermania piniformis]